MGNKNYQNLRNKLERKKYIEGKIIFFRVNERLL